MNSGDIMDLFTGFPPNLEFGLKKSMHGKKSLNFDKRTFSLKNHGILFQLAFPHFFQY